MWEEISVISTLWSENFGSFFAIQILRENDFNHFEALKMAIFTIWATLNSKPPKLLKWHILTLWHQLKLISRKIRVARKFHTGIPTVNILNQGTPGLYSIPNLNRPSQKTLWDNLKCIIISDLCHCIYHFRSLNV